MNRERQLISADQLLRNVRTRMFDYSKVMRELFVKETRKEPTCTAGCAYCCFAKVLIDAGTGAMIYLYLRKHGLWSDELERRLEKADREMAPTAHGAWLATRTPCVFLKSKEFGRGMCTIYPVRPFSCALTFSTTPDPAACAVPDEVVLQLVVEEDDRNLKWVLEYHEAFLNGCGETKTWVMTIPGAVLYGRALVEKVAKPLVARIAKEDAQQLGVSIDELFDTAAAEWARQGQLAPVAR
jgi:Fe-S-cluster containining protein